MRNGFIEDTSGHVKEKDYVTRHKKAFGVEPIEIGMFWNAQSEKVRLVDKAITKGEPYNEKDFLSTGDLIKYNNGELFF